MVSYQLTNEWIKSETERENRNAWNSGCEDYMAKACEAQGMRWHLVNTPYILAVISTGVIIFFLRIKSL